jgi:hypothetical protein
MSTICFDKSFFLIIVVIAIAIILYNHYNLVQENKNLRASLHVSLDNKLNKVTSNVTSNVTNKVTNNPMLATENIIPTRVTEVNTMPLPTVGQLIKDYDRRTIDDPLTPPFKRDDYMVPAQIIRPDLYGVYTRGSPGVFKKMGYLKNDTVTDYKFLTLMGRQKYQGSTQYEYYVTSINRDDSIKFYIDDIRKELYEGDKVTVKQLGNTEYDVFIDKNLDLDYNPLL